MKPWFNYIMWEAGDCAGKTTAINTMVDYFMDHGIETLSFHNGPYDTPELALKAYSEQMNDAELFVNETNGVVLWDRAHLSSHVYGLLVDKKIPAIGYFMEIDHRFMSLGTKLMYAKTDTKTMIKSWYSNISNELIKMEADMNRIYAYYEYVMKFSTVMTPTPFDYQKNDIIKDFKWIAGA